MQSTWARCSYIVPGRALPERLEAHRALGQMGDGRGDSQPMRLNLRYFPNQEELQRPADIIPDLSATARATVWSKKPLGES